MLADTPTMRVRAESPDELIMIKSFMSPCLTVNASVSLLLKKVMWFAVVSFTSGCFSGSTIQ